MKRQSCLQLVLATALAVLVVCGCATSGVPDLENNSIYKKQPVTLNASMVEVKKAALEAIAALGSRKLAETDNYYKGQLPRGEVMEIFLKPDGDNKTQAWVKTRITYVGGALQRNREAEVIQEIKRAVAMGSRKAP